MTKCGLKYALAVSDPFNPASRGACVPVGGAPTGKTHAILRFDVIIGTAGVGFVVLNPSIANDMPSGFYTTALFAGTDAVPFSASGVVGSPGVSSTLATGWEKFSMPSPFNTAQLVDISSATPEACGRIVSTGFRAQYTGTTLNESGLHYCYHDPAHNSLSAVNALVMGSFGDANVEGVSRRPCMQAAFAVNEMEVEFSSSTPVTAPSSINGLLSTLYPFSGGSHLWSTAYQSSSHWIGAWRPASSSYGYPLGTPCMAYLVTGVAGQSVHIELITHFEFAGQAAQGLLTPSTSDVQSAFAVRTAALALPQMKLSAPTKSSWDLMYTSMQAIAKTAMPVLVPLAEKALMAALL